MKSKMQYGDFAMKLYDYIRSEAVKDEMNPAEVFFSLDVVSQKLLDQLKEWDNKHRMNGGSSDGNKVTEPAGL